MLTRFEDLSFFILMLYNNKNAIKRIILELICKYYIIIIILIMFLMVSILLTAAVSHLYKYIIIYVYDIMYYDITDL